MPDAVAKVGLLLLDVFSRQPQRVHALAVGREILTFGVQLVQHIRAG